ncbi:MAG: hypothetical protein ACI9FR_003141 [Cryomorphaceae bacterium]|jgi:hypothetical protein
MHATIEQLLEIKDGLESPLSSHVQNCEHCQSKLRQLNALSQEIFDSANMSPPQHVWGRIQQSFEFQDHEINIEPKLLAANASRGRFNWGSLNTAIYTLALSILVTGLVGFYSLNSQQSVVYQQAEQLQASIEQLMLNSRGLESVLQKVNDTDSGLNAAERDVADRLYWRLMYVDQMIHESNGENQQDPQKMQVLWGDRVNALTELNQLFYGGPTNIGDPEI